MWGSVVALDAGTIEAVDGTGALTVHEPCELNAAKLPSGTLAAGIIRTVPGTGGPPHPALRRRALAMQLEARGRFDEARDERHHELDAAVAALGEHDMYVAITASGLGRHHMLAGRPKRGTPE